MDIEYLLLLQNFREATHDFFSPFLMWISNFAVGFWPIAFACMIYWAFDRRAGKRILAGFGAGVLANGLLKLIFRIPRPWLRDDRVLPYGDSKTSATGYSFPSGHSTFATGLFGGIGWWQRKRSRILAVVFFACMLLTLFSRNYLGVHTPQDVIVGALSTVLMMFVAGKVEDWTDQNPRRDWFVMGTLLTISGLLVLYYETIQIEPIYDASGLLSVDPAKMKADSFEGIGFISAFAVCRCLERRLFDFDVKLSQRWRLSIGAIALVPLYLWCNYILEICIPLSRALGCFATQFGIVVYTMIIVPLIMSKIRLPQRKVQQV